MAVLAGLNGQAFLSSKVYFWADILANFNCQRLCVVIDQIPGVLSSCHFLYTKLVFLCGESVHDSCLGSPVVMAFPGGHCRDYYKVVHAMRGSIHNILS